MFFSHVVQSIYCFLIAARYPMAVDIDGDLDAVMSQLVFNINGRYTITQQLRGITVPQVMKANSS
ncbi:MAG: hypothetical protein ABSE95_06385 [Thermodesulfobacteriota bacterium]